MFLYSSKLDKIVKNYLDSPVSICPNSKNSTSSVCPISGKVKLFFKVATFVNYLPSSARLGLEEFRDFLERSEDIVFKRTQDVFHLTKKLLELPDERLVLRTIYSSLPSDGTEVRTKAVFENLNGHLRTRLKSLRALSNFFLANEDAFEVRFVPIVMAVGGERLLPAFVAAKVAASEDVLDLRMTDDESSCINALEDMSLAELEKEIGPLDSDYESE